MPTPRSTGALVMSRVPAAILSAIVYGEREMPMDLAETIRTLRREHRFTYEDLMWALAEGSPDAGQCFGYGRALTELACLRLGEHLPEWR